MSQDQYRVVYVEPGKPAREMMLGKDLKDLQQAVGGLIELIYAHDDRTIIVGNDEAKLIGMEGNRRLSNGRTACRGDKGYDPNRVYPGNGINGPSKCNGGSNGSN